MRHAVKDVYGQLGVFDMAAAGVVIMGNGGVKIAAHTAGLGFQIFGESVVLFCLFKQVQRLAGLAFVKQFLGLFQYIHYIFSFGHVGGKNIAEVTAMSVKDALAFAQNLQLDKKDTIISRNILKEIRARLSFLTDVGLTYLTLNRRSETLSGGEAQRIHLATQIGSGLTGVLYVLDEPTIGLHPRDNTRLLTTLKTLRDLGNTLIVVEHDEETIRTADWLIDLGPAAGELGGNIMLKTGVVARSFVIPARTSTSLVPLPQVVPIVG